MSDTLQRCMSNSILSRVKRFVPKSDVLCFAPTFQLPQLHEAFHSWAFSAGARSPKTQHLSSGNQVAIARAARSSDQKDWLRLRSKHSRCQLSANTQPCLAFDWIQNACILNVFDPAYPNPAQKSSHLGCPCFKIDLGFYLSPTAKSDAVSNQRRITTCRGR